MSLKERVLHALLFELLAILISILAVTLTTPHQTEAVTVVIILISSIAVVWNFIFNWIFDRFFTVAREQRSWRLRTFHTLAFEGGLLLFTLPVVAYILQIDWWRAFMLDIGLTLLIVVYTFCFNWAYDHLRLFFIK